jgi:hypothetical protein
VWRREEEDVKGNVVVIGSKVGSKVDSKVGSKVVPPHAHTERICLSLV